MIESLNVSQVTKHIKNLLESDVLLQSVWVKGEISNYTLHASGHQYFSLKDENAVLRCVKFKNFGYTPAQQSFKTGDKVLVHGSIDLYPPQGSYQLRATQIHLQGLGDLHQQFEQLKNRLAAEGLFDARYKKTIPSYPATIGIISSATGAVIQDILNTIARRFPSVKVLLVPALMQGEKATDSVIAALKKLHTIKNIDTIIIARGGGSMEDLWPFNDEKLVREIHASIIPVISAVGHETDFTFCDFVADLRAPTPTAAAELAVPDQNELLARLAYLKKNINRIAKNYVAYNFEQLDDLRMSLNDAISYTIENKQHQLDKLLLKLETANPLMPLQKGFSITTRNGVRVNSALLFKKDDAMETIFIDGTINSTVN